MANAGRDAPWCGESQVWGLARLSGWFLVAGVPRGVVLAGAGCVSWWCVPMVRCLAGVVGGENVGFPGLWWCCVTAPWGLVLPVLVLPAMGRWWSCLFGLLVGELLCVVSWYARWWGWGCGVCL